ncbi:MAG: histidine kinase dimerization/phosphoacceptor domain-containing protein [Verrucomicrobia bacterium]|nr:histidine kinase dimerization/phosphoacceptor domain-containing protein [Verrucomicrobiota bacterium]
MPIGSHRLFRRRYWPAWATLVLGLTASAGLGWKLHRQAVELDQSRLQRIANVVLDRLHTKVQTTDLILRQAQDYFGSQGIITDGMFREWCRKYGWSATAPWMHGLALYTNLNAGLWRAEVPPDPAGWTEPDFHRFAEFARETPVKLQLAFSYSHDTTKRWPASYATQMRFAGTYQGFGAAIPANTPRTTDRQIVIERDGGKTEYGATVAVPVYEASRDELRDLIAGPPPKVHGHLFNWNLGRGLLVAPLDYITLESLIWGDEPREIGVEIYSSNQPQLEAWLNPSGHPPRALDSAFKPYLTASVPWSLYNGRWSLFVYTLPAFEAGSPRYMARLTFVAGAAMTLLATAMVGLGLRAQNRQKLLTQQIREARDALASGQKEREKLSHDLHDNTIQSLYAVQLGLSRTAQKLSQATATVRSELAGVQTELDAVIAEMRRFITAEERAEQTVDLPAVLLALVQRARAGVATKVCLRCDEHASDRLTSTHPTA